jgi:hypothetical protein
LRGECRENLPPINLGGLHKNKLMVYGFVEASPSRVLRDREGTVL